VQLNGSNDLRPTDGEFAPTIAKRKTMDNYMNERCGARLRRAMASSCALLVLSACNAQEPNGEENTSGGTASGTSDGDTLAGASSIGSSPASAGAGPIGDDTYESAGAAPAPDLGKAGVGDSSGAPSSMSAMAGQGGTSAASAAGEGGRAETPAGVCGEGQTRGCNSGSCPGLATCRAGAWSACEANGRALPASCQCIPGARRSCGGPACAVDVTCGNDFTWPACPVPDNCTCDQPGRVYSCANDGNLSHQIDFPCGQTTCGSDYRLTGPLQCQAKLALYPDADADGWGDGGANRKLVCAGSAGYAANGNDCDDGDGAHGEVSYTSSSVPAVCTKSFDDHWSEGQAFWSCLRPADFDGHAPWNTESWTFSFHVSQSGNVATDATDAASVCCSNDAVHAAGACVTIDAADFAADSHFSLTCNTAGVVYNKLGNAGGWCCGGYKRWIIPDAYSHYPHC
jgi:hypothetical protein